jgi:hypothetical protein
MRSLTPERLPPEPVSQKRQDRKNEKDDEEDLRPGPGVVRDASEAEDRSDQGDDEESDGQA